MKKYIILILILISNVAYTQFTDKQNQTLGAANIAIYNNRLLLSTLISMREAKHWKQSLVEIENLEGIMLNNLRPILDSTYFIKDTKYCNNHIKGVLEYFEEFSPKRIILPKDHKKTFEESLKLYKNPKVIEGYKQIYEKQIKLLTDLESWKAKNLK